MTDMEGVAGVVSSTDYCAPHSRYYEVGRELTTRETNAAIEGALDAGATEFLVVDEPGHGAIDPRLLHPPTLRHVVPARAPSPRHDFAACIRDTLGRIANSPAVGLR